MSLDAPARTDLRTGLRAHRVEIVLARRMVGEGWRLGRWFWAAAAVIAVVVAVVIAQFTPITESVWENAAQWPRWWLLGVAIALVTVHLPLVVLHGVTRVAALRALAVSGLLISLLWAGFMVIGQVIERFVYDRLGWPDTFTTPHLFSDGYDVLPMLAEYWLIFFAYLITGALVGGMYYRFGGVRGTLLLPLGLLPAAAIEILLATGWFGSGLAELSVERPSAVVVLLGSAVVLALAGLAVHRVLRDVPIHGKK